MEKIDRNSGNKACGSIDLIVNKQDEIVAWLTTHDEREDAAEHRVESLDQLKSELASEKSIEQERPSFDMGIASGPFCPRCGAEETGVHNCDQPSIEQELEAGLRERTFKASNDKKALHFHPLAGGGVWGILQML